MGDILFKIIVKVNVAKMELAMFNVICPKIKLAKIMTLFKHNNEVF